VSRIGQVVLSALAACGALAGIAGLTGLCIEWAGRFNAEHPILALAVMLAPALTALTACYAYLLWSNR
jgi:hypothetical protein